MRLSAAASGELDAAVFDGAAPAGSGRSGSTLITTVLGQLDGCFAAGELRYLWQRGMVDNRPCGCGAPFVTSCASSMRRSSAR